MRVLMLSTDRNICRPESPVALRMKKYGKHLEALDIIVLSTRKHGFKKFALSDKVTVHPTDSRIWQLYAWDAIRIGRGVRKPDLISSQDPFEVGLVASFLARIYNVPLHVQIHTDFIASGYVRGSVIRRARQMMARVVLGRATRVRVVLLRIAELLKRRGLKAPITVLPVYVDVARFRDIVHVKHPRFKIALLVFSRLEQEKRIACAISALKEVREKGHEACLTIVGDGSLRRELEVYAREQGVDRFVEFAGWKDDVRPYLATAQLVLVPSDYEGYGMTIVEALAAGVPVLSTDVGIAEEAGAIITSRVDFPQALIRWIERGPRKATLKGYPYANFEEYCKKIVEDLRACVADFQNKKK